MEIYNRPDMEIWTREEEAANLTKLLTGVNRSALAREYGINHNIIYQHMSGLKPISLHVALMYAKTFKVPLEKISPRLAQEVQQVREVQNMASVTSELSADAKELLELIEGLDARGKKKVLLAVYDVIDAHKATAQASQPEPAKPVNYGNPMPAADLAAVNTKHYTLSVDQLSEKHHGESNQNLPHRKGSPQTAPKHRKLKVQ